MLLQEEMCTNALWRESFYSISLSTLNLTEYLPEFGEVIFRDGAK
jgi:hypothetical protein